MILGKSAVNNFECNFNTVLIIILISYAANGNHVEYPDVPESLDMIKAIGEYNSDKKDIDDDKYPYEKLEQIVRDTYELLKSDDEEGKRKLKMDPADYEEYLCKSKMPGSTLRKKCGKSGRNSEEASRAKSGRRGKNIEEGCPTKHELIRPKHKLDVSGNEYYILNVNEFVQYIKIAKCVYSTHICGNVTRDPDPLLFESNCIQGTEIVKMFVIPVNEDLLVKENLEKVEVPFVTRCDCELQRILQSKNEVE